jgi:LPXTG-motif cell wall-anchored protein
MEQATRRAELTRSVSFIVAAALALGAGALLFTRRRELLAALARRSAS